jgi:hypothetical protein
MTLPNFVVIGAAKAGTTSLHYWLGQHPDVFMPTRLKETLFFCFDPATPEHVADAGRRFPITTLSDYEALFADAGAARAVGEVTPAYLNSPVAPAAARRLVPDARLVVSLREPVSRIYSYAQMRVRQGAATDLAAESRRLAATGEHHYAQFVQQWLDHFPRAQLKAVRYDDLARDPRATVAEIFRFLDVDESFVADTSEAHNAGGVPRSQRLQRVIQARALRRLRPLAPALASTVSRRLRNANLAPAQPISAQLREELRDIFRADIRQTQQVLQLDLSEWLAD